MSDIKLVKLKSGEELIGDVTVVGDSVTIANPCQIIFYTRSWVLPHVLLFPK